MSTSIDGDDLELFERSLRHANEQHTGGALDAALDQMGWPDALGFDRRAAVSIQFEQQGRANTRSSALDLVVATALGVAARAVVLPAIGGWEAPGRVSGASLSVDGLLSAAAAAGSEVVVVADARAHTVRLAELTLDPVAGLDPALGLVRVTGTAAIPGGDDAVAVDWDAAVDAARLAIAHELVGASRTMLEYARVHALERIQFGQPIAAFQAVRHRLAETLVAIETADAALDAAWLDASSRSASMAKSVAGRSARMAVKHCQQVLAGIGFTTEHDFHRYLRRALLLDELFGAARTLTKALGAEAIASRRVPPLLPL